MKTKICIPVVENSIEKIKKEIKEIKNLQPDLIEIWLGEVKKITKHDVKFIRSLTNIGLIANCKDNKEKGNFRGGDIEKLSILKNAIEYDFEYIDCDIDFEFKNELTDCKKDTTKFIFSKHFFETEIEEVDFLEILKKFHKNNGDVLKISSIAESETKVQEIISFANKLSGEKIKHIIIAMGELGKITRKNSPELKNEIMFATKQIKKNKLGQMSISELRESFKFL